MFFVLVLLGYRKVVLDVFELIPRDAQNATSALFDLLASLELLARCSELLYLFAEFRVEF
jgi:hypothetical protein